MEAITEYGGADVAVVTAASPRTFEQAYASRQRADASGRTKVIVERRRLEDVNECFDEVLAGHVPARLVFTF